VEDGRAQSPLLAEAFCIRLDGPSRNDIVERLKCLLVLPYQGLGGKILFEAFYQIGVHGGNYRLIWGLF
jgi:hypothetical protein